MLLMTCRAVVRIFTGFVFASLFAGIARGADYWLKSGATDWADANSYTNASGASPAEVPGSADTVYLPEETFAVDSTSASFATLSTFYRLVPKDATRLEITVPAGVTNSLGCAFNRGGESGNGRQIGELVKKGAGHLKLQSMGRVRHTTSNYAHDYCTQLTLAEGSLALPQDPDSVARSQYGIIVTSNETMLVADTNPSRTDTQWAQIDRFSIGGVLVNASVRPQLVIFTTGYDGGRNSEVTGAVCGNIRFWMVGSIDFIGTNSTFTGGATATGWDGSTAASGNGHINVYRFGSPDAPSCVGSNNILLAYNHAAFRYLGTEPERTTRNILTYSDFALDGGAYGALTFAGTFKNTADASAGHSGQHLVFLDGNHANPCVYSGGVQSASDNDNVYGPEFSFYMIKRGTGTWLFSGPKNGGSQGWNGGLAVEEGSLQFDSLTEAGRDCSLGTATKLTYKHMGVWTTDCWVDYAIALGSVAPASAAVLEYVGVSPASCTTRPLALSGTGGHLRASHGKLLFSGITAREENGSPTLTLDGSGTKNRVSEVSDGAVGAKLSIAKDGAGTWSLGGNLTFSGDVTVRQGTLNVKTPGAPTPTYRDYKRFRLTIAEIADGKTNELGICGQSNTLTIRQIGLFDKDGVRQNFGLTIPTSSYDAGGNTIRATTLQPGEACFGPSMAGKTIGGSGRVPQLSICFDGSYSSSGGSPFSAEFSPKPVLSDSSTWAVIDMYLPESANPVTHFDVQGYYMPLMYVPHRLKLEASVDGETWTTVWSNLEAAAPHYAVTTKWNGWMSDGVAGSASNRPLGTGFTLTKSGEDYVKKNYFNRFRLSIAKLEGGGKNFYMRQIGLYDANGNRVNVGLTLAENATPAMGATRTIQTLEIGPGQCGYDPSVVGYKVVPAGHPDQTVVDLPAAFDGGDSGTPGRYSVSWRDPSGTELVPTPAAPSTWIPIVMHLPDGTAPVTQFDVQSFYSGDSFRPRQFPVRMKLEGSIDGENWVEAWSNLDEADDLNPDFGSTATYNKWLRTGLASRADVGAKGFQLTNTYWNVQESYDQLQHVNAIEVKPGAKFTAENPLSVKALRIDTTGAGTFSNLVFAASGNLDVVSSDAPSGVLPGTYLDCQNIGNLAHWTVSLNGTPRPGYELSVSEDGKVSVIRPGLLIIVR